MSLKPNELTACEALALLKSRQFTAKQLVIHCLDQIETFESDVHAWAYLNPDLAVMEAEKLDQKLDTGSCCPKGLFGIPVGVKDVFNTHDMPTQMGSPIWQDFHPGNDARVVHYLRMSDAIILGKTVTAEFAVHTPGPTRNPHNIDYLPGTSSSGSAAAVSLRMVPLALGTQTAGSILRPASYCGVYGFKPSFGLVPRTGVLKTTDTLDTIGGFARSIDDIELLFETIRVHGRDFPLNEQFLNDPACREKQDNKPWRVGLVKGPKWNFAEPYAQESILKFAERLANHQEIDLEMAELPAGFELAHEVHSIIYDRTLAYYFQREFHQHTLVSPTMYEIITRGNEITLAEYQEALKKQKALADKLDAFMEARFDFLISLTTGGEPLKDLDAVDRPDNCLIWTLCGIPALNLPVFSGPANLPFGAQLVSRRYNDYLLLNFASQLEKWGFVGDAPCPKPTIARQKPEAELVSGIDLQTNVTVASN